MKRRDLFKSALFGGGTSLFARNVIAAPAVPKKRVVRFAHMTDVHVYPGRSAANGLARAIQHVHNLDDPPGFILNGGDAINDALAQNLADVESEWQLWHTAWKTHGALPVRHCLGNHDVWGWDQKKSRTTGKEAGWGKQLALDHLQLDQAWYQFEQGGWKFMVLDSMTYDAETAYRAELDQEQLQWLKNELANTPASTPVVIVSHIPILSVGTLGFTFELRKYPQGKKMLVHRDAYEILDVLRHHSNVKLCLSGHTHQTESITYGNLNFINSGAVCGLWWKGDFLHTSEGYNLIDLYDDGTFETAYIDYGWKVKS